MVAGNEKVEVPATAVSGGDPTNSFEAFYRRNYPAVLSLSFVLSGSWTVAEGVTQEAFIRAMSRWDGRLHHPDAWVRQVAANLTRSRLRRIGAEVRALGRLGSRPAAPPPGADPIPPELMAFWAAVRGLPARQAQAVAFHYLEDRSVRDVAELMDCAEGTVKALLHQARRRLVMLLEPDAETRR